MPEWSIGPHSKCGVRATVPGVRIPLSPLITTASDRNHSVAFCFALVCFCKQCLQASSAKQNRFATLAVECKEAFSLDAGVAGIEICLYASPYGFAFKGIPATASPFELVGKTSVTTRQRSVAKLIPFCLKKLTPFESCKIPCRSSSQQSL